MVFNGILKSEALFFHLEDDEDEVHFIEMERDSDTDLFSVRVCCNNAWEWKFFDVSCNYELVKHAVFDIAFDSHNMNELIEGLDEVFEDMFNEIVAWECEATCDCNNSCNHCNCK